MEGSNDSVLGKDYVVVEKRTVEINALADGELFSPFLLRLASNAHCHVLPQSSQTYPSEKARSLVDLLEVSSRDRAQPETM